MEFDIDNHLNFILNQIYGIEVYTKILLYQNGFIKSKISFFK
jgi:hypothetical protein